MKDRCLAIRSHPASSILLIGLVDNNLIILDKNIDYIYLYKTYLNDRFVKIHFSEMKFIENSNYYFLIDDKFLHLIGTSSIANGFIIKWRNLTRFIFVSNNNVIPSLEYYLEWDSTYPSKIKFKQPWEQSSNFPIKIFRWFKYILFDRKYRIAAISNSNQLNHLYLIYSNKDEKLGVWIQAILLNQYNCNFYEMDLLIADQPLLELCFANTEANLIMISASSCKFSIGDDFYYGFIKKNEVFLFSLTNVFYFSTSIFQLVDQPFPLHKVSKEDFFICDGRII